MLLDDESGADGAEAAMTFAGDLIPVYPATRSMPSWRVAKAVATVLGLAFKLYDPDHLIGEQDEYGITAALIPTDIPGVEFGRRQLAASERLGHDLTGDLA